MSSYILQVAGVGILVVVAVLIFLIFFVKMQSLVVTMIDSPTKKQQQDHKQDQQQKKEIVEKAQPIIEDTDNKTAELSPQVVAAITAAIYLTVQKPVRISSIKVISPR